MELLVRVLNVLIWKLPWGGRGCATDMAEYIVAELADKDIVVQWNGETEEFYY